MGTCQMHSSLSTIGLGSVFFSFFFHHLHLQPSLRLCSQHFLFNFDMTLVAKLCERLMSIGFKFEHSSWSSGYQMDLNDIIGAGPNSQIGHTFNTSKHLEVPRLKPRIGFWLSRFSFTPTASAIFVDRSLCWSPKQPNHLWGHFPP